MTDNFFCEIDKKFLLNSEYDVSVIVPMFNVEGLIGETIKSLKLNYSKIEFILVDDGSTDETVNNAKLAIEDDIRFKIFEKINEGVSKARNYGLAHASGNYIIFVDSDDLLPEFALDNLLDLAKKNDADIVYGAIKKFNKSKSWYIDAHIRHGIFIPGEKKIEKNTELIFFISILGKLIKKELAKKCSFPEGMIFSEDTVFMMDAWIGAKKIYATNEIVYLYRERDIAIHEASATQLKKQKSSIYLSDVIRSIRLTRNSILNKSDISLNHRYEILKKYYDRIFSYEFWPLFVDSLSARGEVQRKVLDNVLSFLQEHNEELINKIPAIRFFFIRKFIDQIFLLKKSSFFAYRKIVRYVVDHLNDDIKKICESPEFYGKKWDDSICLAYNRPAKAFLKFISLREKKRVNYFLNKNKNDFARFLFKLFLFLPIDRKKIIFSSNRKKPASDNFDAVLKVVSNEYNNIKKFLGFDVNVFVLIKRYYHFATAGVVFLEDYHKPIYGLNFKSKTKVIQLWHGCGAFKKFAHDAIGLGDSHPLEFERAAHAAYTDIIVSSDEVRSKYATAFDKALENVHALGVPRTDVFFNREYKEKNKKRFLEKFPNDKINIVYAPTFRGNASVRSVFNLIWDWNQFDKEFFKKHRLIFKMHPHVKSINPKIPNDILKNIEIVDSHTEINELMIGCDLLITDYSSLIFEYALLNKPIIHFVPDINQYLDERGFYYSYDNYVYGQVVIGPDRLKEAILSCKRNDMRYLKDRKDFIAKFMNRCDGQASKRILELIETN